MVPPEPPGPIIPSIVSIDPGLPVDNVKTITITLSSVIPPEDESKYRWLADISPYGIIQSEYDDGWWFWDENGFYMEGTLESSRDEIRFDTYNSGHSLETIQLISIDNP